MACSKLDTGLEDLLDYSKKALLLECQQWHDFFKRLLEYLRLKFNKPDNDEDSIQKYNTVEKSLKELSTEIDRLQIAISVHNRLLQCLPCVDEGSRNFIQESKRGLDLNVDKINELIVRINEEIACFSSAGQARVEKVECWIPRALLVCVGGFLVLAAASFAVARKLT